MLVRFQPSQPFLFVSADNDVPHDSYYKEEYIFSIQLNTIPKLNLTIFSNPDYVVFHLGWYDEILTLNNSFDSHRQSKHHQEVESNPFSVLEHVLVA